MSEEKEILENEEAVAETAAEPEVDTTAVNEADTAAESEAEADDNSEGTDEEALQTEEVSDDLSEHNITLADQVPEKQSHISKPAVSLISIVATLIVCAVAFFTVYEVYYNPYNANKDGYGMTLATYAKQMQQDVASVKSELSLPADMRDDTLIDMAQYYIPVSKMAENYGMTVDELLQATGLSGIENLDISDDTYWGEITLLMLREQEAQMEAESDTTASEEPSEQPSEEAAADDTAATDDTTTADDTAATEGTAAESAAGEETAAE